MSAHVLLNLFNELRKRDEMPGSFRNKLNKVNNARARLSYGNKITLITHFSCTRYNVVSM